MSNNWGFRIDAKNSKYLYDELKEGRLRQGWGYHEGQNLKLEKMTFDNGASRNLRMLKVKKGDYILVPRIPEWHQIVIAEATEDWNNGYKFEISQEKEDYGHIFPAKILTVVSRKSSAVTSYIRSSFRCSCRFWSMNHLEDDIMRIVSDKDNLHHQSSSSTEDKVKMATNIVFSKEFSESLKREFNRNFGSQDWEYVLALVFKAKYPYATVEQVGGKKEELHGTDILIRFPAVSSNDNEYLVAIQVKDYQGQVSQEPLDQILKSSYWEDNDSNAKVIDRIIVLIGASDSQNCELKEEAKKRGISVMYEDDVQNLLLNYACGLQIHPEL